MILTSSDPNATVRDQIGYRKGLQHQALSLLAKRKKGRYLDNTEKRILRGWQRLEAQKRTEAEGRNAA